MKQRVERAWWLAVCLLGACGDDGGVQTGMDPSTATGSDCACRLDVKFDNLAVCQSPSTEVAPAHVSSSHLDAASRPACDAYADPLPVPATPWGRAQVSSSCTGAGQLCVTLRAGDSAAPVADDCQLMRQCADVAYPTAKQALTLPSFPGWAAQSSTCSQRYLQLGGYYELTVASDQLGCGLQDVRRIAFCPDRCKTAPTGEGCDKCVTPGQAVETTF